MYFKDGQPSLFGRYELRAEGTFNHQTRECRYPVVLQSLTDIASDHTAYSNFLIEFELTYYIEILLKLRGAVCRERPELWLTVGYMKLCARDLN